jgi:NAD(P)H-dependent FMN reductase
MLARDGQRDDIARPTLLIVIASTRPGRIGMPVREWFRDRAEADGRFAVEVADLARIELPLLDEPNHPRLRQYTRPHTEAWSAIVDPADALVFVMPEYNHSFTAPLKNAIDYLNREWQYKPLGFVSYGGIAAGARAVEALIPVVATLKLVPLVEAVQIPFVAQSMDDQGSFQPSDSVERAATTMLGELVKWEAALRSLRRPVAQPV